MATIPNNESHANDNHGHGQGHVGHIVPTPFMFAVLLGLLFLTFVTVAVSRVDLGRMNIWIAMLVATVKASLVVLYFMHLRWDRPFNALVFISSLLFVALFIAFSAMDTGTYQDQILTGKYNLPTAP
ncbi:MAG: cytochrome C oxidase subunit IV family protein [Phycisphaerae bacterium]